MSAAHSAPYSPRRAGLLHLNFIGHSVAPDLEGEGRARSARGGVTAAAPNVRRCCHPHPTAFGGRPPPSGGVKPPVPLPRLVSCDSPAPAGGGKGRGGG